MIYYSLLLGLRNVWGKLFTKDEEVLEIIRKYIPYSLLVQTFDVSQSICSGVLRGCGFQFFGGIINIICYYCVSVPLSAILVFLVKKDLKMIYYSFTVAIFIQAVIFFIRILLIKWQKMSDIIREKEEATAIDLMEETGENKHLVNSESPDVSKTPDGEKEQQQQQQQKSETSETPKEQKEEEETQ